MILIGNERNELYDLDALRAEDAEIETIAARLAKVNRFGGATPYPYSVAQHSVLVSQLCPPDLALAGLLHDISEAFVTDLPKPIKAQCLDFQAIEARIEEQLKDLGYPLDHSPVVKYADNRAYELEAAHFRVGVDCFHCRELGWSEARDLFLSEYAELRLSQR